MLAATEELRVLEKDITNTDVHYFTATKGEALVGFYSLESFGENSIELGSMFISPEHIGCGIGKQLMHHAIQNAQTFKVSRLVIQSDPNAIGLLYRNGWRSYRIKRIG